MPEGRYALVVSTSEYRDPNLRKLAAPGHDAEALARVLRDKNIGGFELTSLRNKDAHVVTREVERLFAGRSPDDTVLLYFSGHGVKDDAGNLYLAARDTTRALLRSTGIADGFLREVMRACRARRQVLILDCCFGGAIARGLLAKAGGDVVDVNERFQGQGRVILTASTAMEFAFEEEGVTGEAPLSVFTRTLVDGLRTGEADVGGDHWISVQDLYDYAYKRIAIPGSKQTPTISAIGQEGAILVARVPETARSRSGAQPVILAPAGTARSHDLRPWVRVRDQGNEGSNPAVAAVTALETFLAVRGSDVRLSPRYVYQKSKQLDGQEQQSDMGVRIETLARVLTECGAVPEEQWPYQPGRWQMPKGKGWKELDEQAQAWRARLIPVTSADEIPFHLGKGRPVLASFEVYQSTWMGVETARRGTIAAPADLRKERPIGSVATTIVDFDAAARVIRFAHTWGPNWGDHGFGEMSLDAARVMFKQDEMWAVEARTAGGAFGWEPAVFTPADARAAVPPPAPAPRPAPAPPRPATRPKRKAAAAPERAPGRWAVYDARQAHEFSAEGLPPGTLARAETDPPAGDPAVDEAHEALAAFHRFFLEVFGRDSWDGAGARLEAVVHYGRDYENAFWYVRRVYIGDGGLHVRALHRIDVIAKELAMGLVQTETKLRYEGQTGALYQALGYVFASLVKQHHLGQTAAEANWLIGEGLLSGGQALASLERPGTAYDNPETGKDPQVGHLSKYRKLQVDNGGVHVNCGIPGRAFVLLAKKLAGHSWERAGRIWYEAVCGGKLGPRTTFRQFAQRTLAVAQRRFAGDRAVARAVRDSWSQVGIRL